MRYFFYAKSNDDLISVFSLSKMFSGPISLISPDQAILKHLKEHIDLLGGGELPSASFADPQKGDVVFVHSYVSRFEKQALKNNPLLVSIVYFYDCILWPPEKFEYADKVCVISELCQSLTIDSLRLNFACSEKRIRTIKNKFIVIGALHQEFTKTIVSMHKTNGETGNYSLVVTPNFFMLYSRVVFLKSLLALLGQMFQYRKLPRKIISDAFRVNLKDLVEAIDKVSAFKGVETVYRSREKDRPAVIRSIEEFTGRPVIRRPSIDLSEDNNALLISNSAFTITWQSFSCLEAAAFNRPCLNLMLPVHDMWIERIDKARIYVSELRGQRLGSMVNFPGVNSCLHPDELIHLTIGGEYNIVQDINLDALEKYCELYFPRAKIGKFL
ncbi:MAG: hypothetical protein VXZ77_03575 [Pseudomonadota bacterium]|nr:hypothetical protein [Pseudomonadota bacterium]